jgi:hypothetical protein
VLSGDPDANIVMIQSAEKKQDLHMRKARKNMEKHDIKKEKEQKLS